MRLLRLAFSAVALASCAASLRAQTVLFADDFESGLAHWSTSDLWHELNSAAPCATYAYPFPSGTRCAWFGTELGCNFNTGTPHGALTLVSPVALPANATSIALAFQSNSEGEDDGMDARSVEVSTDGVNFVELGQVLTSNWYEQRFDLSALAGQAVYVRFSFAALTTSANFGRGWFVDDVHIETNTGVVGTNFCAGDGSARDCPCMNFGAPGHGCANSFDANGALLTAFGSAHTNNDSVVLSASGLSVSVVNFYQGSQQAAGGQGVLFGDGLRCTGSSIVRLKSVLAVGGHAQFPGPNDVELHVAGLVPASGVRTYQVSYRNAANFCTSSTFNSTNGWALTWMP